MSKTLDSRLDDTAVALVRNLGSTGYGLLAGILSTLELPGIAGRRESILGALSLGGGWRGPKALQSDAKTEARNLERALILAKLTIGGVVNPAHVNSQVKDMARAAVLNELRSIYAIWSASLAHPPAVAPKARIELAPTFSVTNSYERYAVQHCIDRAVALASFARDAAERATTDPAACFLFTKWFGIPTPGRVSTVTDNLSRLHGAICARPLKLYYRGNKLGKGQPDDEPGGEGYYVFPKPDIFAETFGSRTGIAPHPFDPRYTHIWLGELFFQELTQASRSGFDSQAGVFLHELTHAFCDTDDVDWKGHSAYGQNTCMEIALEAPELAIKNADNYEFFAEEFRVTSTTRMHASGATCGRDRTSIGSCRRRQFKNCSTRSQVRMLAGRAQAKPWTVRQ
jgi:hypothetical protein